MKYPLFSLEENSHSVIQYCFHIIGNFVADIIRNLCAFYVINVSAVLLFILL